MFHDIGDGLSAAAGECYLSRMPNAVSELTIRKASAEDAKLVSILGIVTFYEAYFEQDSPEDMVGYLYQAFDLNAISVELADPNADFYIAYRDGYAVGYAKMLRGSTAHGLKGNSPVELKRIYLVERVWGAGVGEKLLSFCEAAAREAGHDTLWLGVWQENKRARRFYVKYGYEKVGTVTFPYGDTVGINDVMEKRL